MQRHKKSTRSGADNDSIDEDNLTTAEKKKLVEELRKKYFKVFSQKPRGKYFNDINWMRGKLEAAKKKESDSSSSDSLGDEDENDDDDDDDEEDDDEDEDEDEDEDKDDDNDGGGDIDDNKNNHKTIGELAEFSSPRKIPQVIENILFDKNSHRNKNISLSKKRSNMSGKASTSQKKTKRAKFSEERQPAMDSDQDPIRDLMNPYLAYVRKQMMEKVFMSVETDIKTAMRAYLRDLLSVTYEDPLAQRIHQVTTEQIHSMLNNGGSATIFEQVFDDIKSRIEF